MSCGLLFRGDVMSFDRAKFDEEFGRWFGGPTALESDNAQWARMLADAIERLDDLERTPAASEVRPATAVEAMAAFTTGVPHTALPHWDACVIQRSMNGIFVHSLLDGSARAAYVFKNLEEAYPFVTAVLAPVAPAAVADKPA